jgi:hypothetical protein
VLLDEPRLDGATKNARAVKASDEGCGDCRCLSGGLLQLCCLPVPGQRLIDALGPMILQARQHVGEPGQRICVVELGGFDQGVDGGGSPAASSASTLLPS